VPTRMYTFLIFPSMLYTMPFQLWDLMTLTILHGETEPLVHLHLRIWQQNYFTSKFSGSDCIFWFLSVSLNKLDGCCMTDSM
jgi:hypothetical protein